MGNHIRRSHTARVWLKEDEELRGMGLQHVTPINSTAQAWNSGLAEATWLAYVQP